MKKSNPKPRITSTQNISFSEMWFTKEQIENENWLEYQRQDNEKKFYNSLSAIGKLQYKVKNGEAYDETKRYKVYILKDPRVKRIFKYQTKTDFCFKFFCEPFYVGMGVANRAETHTKVCKRKLLKNETLFYQKDRKIAKILKIQEEPIIQIIESGLTQVEALLLEIELIKLIGRSDLKKGPLTNLTDGGEGVTNLKEGLERRLENIKNRPEELKKEIKEEMSKRMLNRTKEQKDTATNKFLNTMNNRTKKQKEETSKKISNSWKENKNKRSLNIRISLANRTEQEKAEFKKMRSEKNLEFWENADEKFKENHSKNSSKNSKKYWEKLTPEEYAIQCNKISESKRKFPYISTQELMLFMIANPSSKTKDIVAKFGHSKCLFQVGGINNLKKLLSI